MKRKRGTRNAECGTLLLILLLISLSPGCAGGKKDFKQDLIGRTTGAGDPPPQGSGAAGKSWNFQSRDQILSLNTIQYSNNTASFSFIPKLGSLEADRLRRDYFVLETELHDKRVQPSYYAQLLLTYRGPKLLSVGLLGIEQLDPPR